MIAIIDYGLGNVLAFANMYRRMAVPVSIARTADDLAGATKLILPGVGAFDYAMDSFRESGMYDIAVKRVTQDKVPVLGICVGMQMLAGGSEEGSEPGLNWVPGMVRKLDTTHFTQRTQLPHMGWNVVSAAPGSTLFAGVESERFYFVHSYAAPARPGDTAAEHGSRFAAAVEEGPLSATQFHPEKSADAGARLLRNWLDEL